MNPADDPSDNIRKKPPSQFIDNQYNICPKIVSQYIESVNVEWSSMLDFGCGQGIKALSLALMHLEKTVVGVDITEAYQKAYEFARDHLHLTKMPENLRFYKITPGQSLGTIIKPDVIYNWSVLEHVERKLIPEIIQDMYQSLNDKGLVFVQIAPLYFSPYGSHLRDYVSKPWAHLELSHEKLRFLVEDKDNETLSLDDRNRRKWMFTRYEALNKITARELKGMPVAAALPGNRLL